jgi:diguanylate cyclase (GGDEF)-like protein
MLEYFLALILLLELALLIAAVYLLRPLWRLPGVRVYIWLAATAGVVWVAEFLRLSGLVQLIQPVRTGIFLLVWMIGPVVGISIVLDLQGNSLGISLPRKGWGQAALLGMAMLVIAAGVWLTDAVVWKFLAWISGSGVILYGMARFLPGYRQALPRYQGLLVAAISLAVVCGLLGIWGFAGFSWDGVALVFYGLVLLGIAGVFLEQKAILHRLIVSQQRQAEEAAENWFLLDPAGRILDFDGDALRLIKSLRRNVIGLRLAQLMPRAGEALAEIDATRRLDLDMEDDFFGTTRTCRFSLYFPLQTRTIFEPRVLKIRPLSSSETASPDRDAEEKRYGDLLRQITLMHTALDAFTQGIMITDSEGNVLFHNQVLIDLLDLPDQTLQADDADWKEKISRKMRDPERLINFISQILNQTAGETLDILECSDGRLLECRTRFYYVNELESGFRLWGFADCTEQQRRERELLHMGMHDTLTGIYNRAFFEMKLRQLRLVSLYPVCMFMVDVDGLKHVNDYQGHPTGDQVLRQAAYILRQACRTEDIVARLGGDEFGLLLIHADEVIAEQVAVRIQGLLNMYNIRHSDVPVSISMGYAIADNPMNMESLFSRADEAMYEARRQHRSGRSLIPTL